MKQMRTLIVVAAVLALHAAADPTFEACTNTWKNGKCESMAAEGKCIRYEPALNCRLSCGMCDVCVDSDETDCAAVVSAGLCDDLDEAANCPASCNKCDALPTPKPTPTPTVAPEYELCLNVLGNSLCNVYYDDGKCSKPEIAADCRLGCGMCEVFDNYDAVCAKVVSDGLCWLCSDWRHGSKCAKACGKCDPTPIPTPTASPTASTSPTASASPVPTASPTASTAPTAAPGFVACTNIWGNQNCADRAAAGKCSRSEVAANCALGCGMCSVCIDYDADYCQAVVDGDRCLQRSEASKCPSSCDLCDAAPTAPPTPTPSAAPDYELCENVWGNQLCATLYSQGRCSEYEVAANCNLGCGMCATCEDYNDEVCATVAAEDKCNNWRNGTKCAKSCQLCRPTPTPSATPTASATPMASATATPTVAPGFVACENIWGNAVFFGSSSGDGVGDGVGVGVGAGVGVGVGVEVAVAVAVAVEVAVGAAVTVDVAVGVAVAVAVGVGVGVAVGTPLTPMTAAISRNM